MSDIAYLALQKSGSEAAGTKWNNVLNDTTLRNLTDDVGAALSWTAQYTVTPAGAIDGNTANSVGSGDASWVDEAIVTYSGHYVGTAWANLRINVGAGEAGNDFLVVLFPSHPAARGIDMRVNAGTIQSHSGVESNLTTVYMFSVQPDGSGNIDIEFRSFPSGGSAYMRAAYVQKVIQSPTVVLDSDLSPGAAMSGSYSNFTGDPTTLTITDSNGNSVSSSSEITDLAIDTGAQTFTFTMPALPSSGSQNGILFGSVTVELT